MSEYSLFERFKKYQVPADSVEDFLARYYKPDRYTGRGEEYAAGLRASYRAEVEQEGFCFISHHDSVMGRTVAYYPPEETSKREPSQFGKETEDDPIDQSSSSTG